MKNITGTAAEGDDFFDREDDFEQFFREFDSLANLLFIAPRRVGKTSFVIELARRLRAKGTPAAFFNAEACQHEVDFAERLIAALKQEGLRAEFPAQIESLFHKARQLLAGLKAGAGGIDVEVSDAADGSGTLGRIISSILRQIEVSDQSLVIIIDELPEMLLTLARGDGGVDRVTHFLHWLRDMRQTYRQRIRWVFLGSIGLDSFVDNRSLRKTINDLTTISLGAYEPAVAHAFLQKLGDDNGLPLDLDVRRAIIDQLGWPLPYYLQLVFHELVQLGTKPVTTPEVDRAIEHLLSPAGYGYFDTWRQRLKEQFDTPDAAAARTVLKLLCQHPEGSERSRLLNELMNKPQPPDLAETEDRLARVLETLQRDGYLLTADGRYAFRSFLLREYWYRREVR